MGVILKVDKGGGGEIGDPGGAEVSPRPGGDVWGSGGEPI